MSILSDYEEIAKNQSKEEKEVIEDFLERYNGEYLLSDVYYREDVVKKMWEETDKYPQLREEKLKEFSQDIETNIGKMPKEDYEELRYVQSGFNNQKELNEDYTAEKEEERKINEWELQRQKEMFEKEDKGKIGIVMENKAKEILGEVVIDVLDSKALSVTNIQEKDNMLNIEVKYMNTIGKETKFEVNCDDPKFFKEALRQVGEDFEVEKHAKENINDRDKGVINETINTFLEDAKEIKSALITASQELDVLEFKQQKSALEEVKDWLSNQISESKMTNEDKKLVIPRLDNECVSPEKLLEMMNEYKEHIATTVINTYENFEKFVENEISYGLYLEGYFTHFEDRLVEEIEENLKTAPEKIKNAYEKLECETSGELLSIGGYTGYKIDLNSFIQDEYRISVMLATENEKILNNEAIQRTFDNGFKDLSSEITDNALCYLVKQQGYELSDFNDKDTFSGFINSVKEEISESKSSKNELTALVTVKDHEILQVIDGIVKQNDFISFSENTAIGLYDEWNGKGSLMDITLDKRAEFPTSMISNVQIEGAENNRGISVGEIYSYGLWEKGSVSIKEITPELIKEKTKSSKQIER